MTVGLAGTGPAAAAIEAAVADVDAAIEQVGIGDLGVEQDLGVVVDQAGSGTFERVTDRLGETDLPWIAVELGGIGGVPVVEASVTGFEPDGACYHCLAARVNSTVSAETEPVSAPDDPTVRFAGAVAGRLAVRQLGGDGSLGTVVELPATERDLLPVPGCACGPSTSRDLDRDFVTRDVDAALARAERALDERLGIVTEVGEVESYPAPYYLATLCDTTPFADEAASSKAAGVDPDWDAAFMKALGEGLERYCAGVYRAHEFTTGPAIAIEAAISPDRFVRPEDWVDGEDRTVERPWVPGEDLASGASVHLPAECVQFPPPERTIRPPMTTGLGLGNSTVEALLSGCYEVIERDATTIAWYSTYAPLELVVNDGAYRSLAARARAEGLDATALLVTQDVDVPVVVGAVTHDEWPELALGSAAHLNPVVAARTALAEAIQNWTELNNLGRSDATDVDGAIGRAADRPASVERFVSVDERVPAGAVGPDTVPTGRAHLAALLDRLGAVDLDAYAARTTTRDVAQLGFEAVRVLVPSAQPLFFETPYFGERARTVPERLGFEPRLERAHHPYP